MEGKKLEMSFDPHTIEHLGVKMYSVLPNAIAELVANAYDADATVVEINLLDIDGVKSISISDNGIGMTFDEINEKFLCIGRKRRLDDNGLSLEKKRKVTGRKGLGKLAFFGIGDKITVETKRNSQSVKFVMSWTDIVSTSGSKYEPKFEVTQCEENSGTTIVLTDLKRKSDFDLNGLSVSLSKLFNFFDESFQVFIRLNNSDPIKLDSKMKFESVDPQIRWNIPTDIQIEYFTKKKVTGLICATEKPLKPGMRGVTLYAHGRLVNAAEFFGVGESSHGYSYLTGWLDIDFVDELTEDVISTDRQSLSWDLPEIDELRVNLQQLLRQIEKDWRVKRKQNRENTISNQTDIDVRKWYGTLSDSVKMDVQQIVSAVITDSELEQPVQNAIVKNLHKLVPEYPYYHWRHLHEQIRSAAKDNYERQDYYHAIDEAVKRYESAVKKRSEKLKEKTGQKLMFSAFGREGTLQVAKNFKKTDGCEFNGTTIGDIEDGQRELSAGIMCGFRNPISHEEIIELHKSNLLNEEDCLDSLSILSHLFRRLDNASEKDV